MQSSTTKIVSTWLFGSGTSALRRSRADIQSAKLTHRDRGPKVQAAVVLATRNSRSGVESAPRSSGMFGEGVSVAVARKVGGLSWAQTGTAASTSDTNVSVFFICVLL